MRAASEEGIIHGEQRQRGLTDTENGHVCITRTAFAALESKHVPKHVGDAPDVGECQCHIIEVWNAYVV